MTPFSPRALAPVLALAIGTWVGFGKPPMDDVARFGPPLVRSEWRKAEREWRRQWPIVEAEARLRWRLFDDFLRGEACRASGIAPLERGEGPPRIELAPPAVDAKYLRDFTPFPRLNPDASLRKAWLLSEGPARKVDVPRRLVTLTFDDGPAPETTPAILRLLARYDVHATFFFIGRYLDGNGERATANRAIARSIVEAGHEIGNHTHDHRALTLESKAAALAQVDDGEASVERATGKRPLFFRPPYGELDAYSEGLLKERGLELVLWSVEAEDMVHSNVEGMVQSLEAQLEHSGGGVVLLHDVKGSTVRVLARLLDWLHRRRYRPETPRMPGYEVVDLPEYIRRTAEAPQPYADRGQLERTRNDDWVKVRPRHKAPPSPRTEGSVSIL